MDNNELFDMQMRQVSNTFNEIETFYSILLKGRLNNTLTTDQKMMYELMDMMIPLASAFREACKDQIFLPYMIEKLHNAASQINSVLEYFKMQGDDIDG